MNTHVFVFVLAFIFCIGEIKSERQVYDLNNGRQLFEEYIDKFGKNYATPEEKENRYKIFFESLKRVNEVNSDPTKTWTAGLNNFSDMNHDEFTKTHTGLRTKDSNSK